MINTIQHQNEGRTVVIAKLLTGYLSITKKVSDPDAYIEKHKIFDDGFTAYVMNWQEKHGLMPDGIIGPDTWTTIAGYLPTCSTGRNQKSGLTMALQMLLDTNITCDAVFGARTKAAVVTFQDSCGLVADGICGPKTWKALIVGKEAQKETPVSTGYFVKPKDFKQYDDRWASKMYSNHGDKSQTMRSSGCGPTSEADVVATLKDPDETPWTLAQLAMKWGDRTDNSGTAWSFFNPHCLEHFKFSKCVKSANWSALTACLDAGGYVVCSMGPGYWTSGGHFICAWKYDETYIYCNDPASSKRTKQEISQFKKERKQYFCFYPDISEKPVDEVPTETVEKPAEVKRGKKIVDISKYQPSVDYDKFIADTALIILRAGYRGTGGGINEDQKFELHSKELLDRGVRFGVYFFSIAKNEEQAKEEARMFYKYAKDKNPLFWAIDVENEGITRSAISAFGKELRRLGAERVGCYVANHLYQKYGYASIREEFDFTWIPRYGSTKPAYRCDLWQYSSTETVSGISGRVDMNRITGDGKSLDWFVGNE